MVVGGRVLRTLETRRRRCPDRVLRDRYHGWLYAALSTLPRKETLGSRSDGLRRASVGSLLGRAAADVHLHAGQPASMAARRRHRKRSAQTAFLDTAAVSPMAESARRIRARPRTVVGVWCRPDCGGCRRQHALAAGTPPPPSGAAASAGFFGTRASQPQRRATLSLSARYFTVARDAVAHWRVELARFS